MVMYMYAISAYIRMSALCGPSVEDTVKHGKAQTCLHFVICIIQMNNAKILRYLESNYILLTVNKLKN